MDMKASLHNCVPHHPSVSPVDRCYFMSIKYYLIPSPQAATAPIDHLGVKSP